MKSPRPAPVFLETLEDRLVLSGLTDASPVLKKISFIDADGDQVSVQVTGKMPKNAGFQVAGAQNGFDIEAINLVGLGPKNDLVINVKPVRFAPSDGTTANAIFSPGYTTIGTITADSQTNAAGRNVDGATEMRHLRLNAAVVSSIQLPETDIFGSISLNTGRTAQVDRINTAAVQLAGTAVSYNPSAGLIDLYDITAKSIRGIQVNGIVAAKPNQGPNLPPLPESPTNDLNGAITISGNLGGIVARNSVFNGDLAVGGNLGMAVFGQFKGTANVVGDAIVRLPATGAAGLFAAGGHVNIGWQPAAAGAGPSEVNVFAGSGISGLAVATTDTIIAPFAFKGKLTNTSTSTDAGTGIANILVTGGEGAFKVVSSNSVGEVRGLRFGGGMEVTAGTGGIAGIISTAGGIGGKYNSAGNIGPVSATGGAITGEFVASGNIGQVTVKTPDTAGITGTMDAGGSIAGLDVAISTRAGLEAINSQKISAGTNIGPIKVNTLSADKVAVGGVIKAVNGITSVEIIATTTETGLSGKINADSNRDNSGNLQSIVVTNNGTGTAVAGPAATDPNRAEIKGASIGSAIFTVRAGGGINTTNNLLFAAGTGGIGSITANNGTMAGTFLANGTNSNITGPILVTGGGIAGLIEAGNSISGSITAQGGGISAEIKANGGNPGDGNIGQITVNTPTGTGVSGKISAANSITGLRVTISSVTGEQAIAAGAEITADGNIGPIIVNSQSRDSEAVAGSISAKNGITSVEIIAATSKTGLSGKIIADSDTNGGTLSAITVTNNGTGTAVAGASDINRAAIRGSSIDALTLTAASGNATAGFVTVQAANNIAGVSLNGNLTSVQINGNLGGDTRFTTTASSSAIGPIIGTGTGNQTLFVSTGSFGTVNAVTFNSLSGGSRLTYDVGANIASLGNITARDVLLTGALTGLTSISNIDASSSANLQNLKAGISSLGNINTSTLTLPADLQSLSSLGSLTAFRVNTTAPVTLGPTNTGVSGAINIDSSSTGGTNDRVTFAFGFYSSQSPRVGGTTLFAGQSVGSFSRT